jgi:kinetochore protein Spc7/SPC105
MASPERKLPAQPRPRSRRSIANVPTEDNMTADMSTLQSGKHAAQQSEKKKSRSKSLGPGGLDALKDEAGNRRKVQSGVLAPPLIHADKSSQLSLLRSNLF